MLPKKSRLPSREFRSPRYRTVGTPYFSLKVAAREEGGPRIGVVAGANVHKSAAKRNFWKRQTKNTLAKLMDKNKGADILIILQPKANTLTKKEFINLLVSAAMRSGAPLKK